MSNYKTKFFGLLLLGLVCVQGAHAAQPTAAPGEKDPEKFDTGLPVEITSDTLEVLQHDNKAIFKGNVTAVQGEVRLKSDSMVVHYKQKNDQQAGVVKPMPTPMPDASKTASTGEMGAITLIEVFGNVLVATPQESAKGDKGNYEVATRILHLFGKNVVLTRDKNIMRGTALEYNMETGRSILTNEGNVVNGKSSGARVRSVFVPEQTPAGAAKPPAKPDKPETPQN